MIEVKNTTRPYDVCELRQRIIDFFDECLRKTFLHPYFCQQLRQVVATRRSFGDGVKVVSLARNGGKAAVMHLQHYRDYVGCCRRKIDHTALMARQTLKFGSIRRTTSPKMQRNYGTACQIILMTIKNTVLLHRWQLSNQRRARATMASFLKWCDGVGCADEWRDTCREAYKRMRKIILSWRYSAVQNAKRIYTRDKESLERWWL